jgi:hypothetical protein
MDADGWRRRPDDSSAQLSAEWVLDQWMAGNWEIVTDAEVGEDR